MSRSANTSSNAAGNAVSSTIILIKPAATIVCDSRTALEAIHYLQYLDEPSSSHLWLRFRLRRCGRVESLTPAIGRKSRAACNGEHHLWQSLMLLEVRLAWVDREWLSASTGAGGVPLTACTLQTRHADGCCSMTKSPPSRPGREGRSCRAMRDDSVASTTSTWCVRHTRRSVLH